MRCRGCGGTIYAVELMPRIIGIEGDLSDWAHDPFARDSEDYELSEHVGFGCNDSECANWYAHIGLTLRNGELVVKGANTLADVAEDGAPTR